MIKLIISTIKGMIYGMLGMNLYIIIHELFNNNPTMFPQYGYTVNVLGAMAVGICFYVPKLIYETDLNYFIKVILHVGIGSISLYKIGLSLDWFSFDERISIIYFVSIILFAFAIILFFITKDFLLSKKMNKKIKQKDSKL